MNDYVPGDVFQINERHDPGDGSRMGWVGAFVLATEIRSWGIQGFVHGIATHATRADAYIRLKWDEIDHIGRAALIPQSLAEPTE